MYHYKVPENNYEFLLPTIQIFSCNYNFYWGSKSLRDQLGLGFFGLRVFRV